MKKESEFQKGLINHIKQRFEGCLVFKMDPTYLQGVPDLLVLYNDRWAALECKKTLKAHHQPNQDYYVNKMNIMSYSSFVAPENEKEVLDDLERALRP